MSIGSSYRGDDFRKDEFLAMISHELRVPLASISYAVRVLDAESSECASQQRMRALVERQVRQMTYLVDQLQDVSRIAACCWKLQCKRVDLIVVVRNAIEALESDISWREHRLCTDLPNAPVWLQADPNRLEQVFVNLLGNASRYTDPGGELRVEVRGQERQAIVHIQDNGAGIEPDTLPHIFELFKQGNDSRCSAGLGVGLAIVRSLVELHGGSVGAASGGAGRGSVFTVRLPKRL
jgi:signal transduction histidine kinase